MIGRKWEIRSSTPIFNHVPLLRAYIPPKCSLPSEMSMTFALNANGPEDLSVPTSSPSVLPPILPMGDMPLPSFLTDCGLSMQAIFAALLGQCAHDRVQPEQRQLPSSQELKGIIHKAILDCLPNKNCCLKLRGELAITIDECTSPVVVKLDEDDKQPCPPSGSKRKSYQPVRILPATTTSPTCHSPDSGALDLSRAASVVSSESQPNTPFKSEPSAHRHEPYENRGVISKMSAIATRKRISHTVGSGCAGRRAFSCNQCNEMEFRSLQHLETHTLEVHGGYRCHVCKAKFTQRSNLQRHALKHVGFKPFQCRLCGHGYYRKDHLMRHMEVLHPSFSARENIEVFLTSSQSLDYLNASGAPLLPEENGDSDSSNHDEEESKKRKSDDVPLSRSGSEDVEILSSSH